MTQTDIFLKTYVAWFSSYRWDWFLTLTFPKQTVKVLSFDDERTLMLRSDEFKDAEAREAAMKTISLGCPAERAARKKENEQKRQSFAASLTPGLNAQGVRPSTGGTAHATLVLEAEFFSKPGQSSRFARQLLGRRETVRNLCEIGFMQVQLRAKKQLLKTVPLVCM